MGVDTGQTEAAPSSPQRTPSDAVKWLLAAGLLRKGLGIAKSVVANELDLRDWMAHAAAPDFRTGRSEVWFDYIADTGDDSAVMRTLAAYFPRAFDANELKRSVAPDRWLGREHPTLQAGAFLFIGGDTAYHVADETTLRERFVNPFNAAIPKPDGMRPIFGIPGNHDYYDNLVGFNRLFRNAYPPGAPSVLPLPGYCPQQEASYMRIKLPGEWELWGADLGPHGLDYRQARYFHEGELPKRLILCTAVPPVCFNRVMVKRTPKDKEYQAYGRLLYFKDAAFTPDDQGRKPPPGTCRLHIAGDKHHYARYSGHRDANDPTPSSLATVVCGGGGAFTHPTEHVCGSLAAAVKYPSEATSRAETARALVWPPTIINAGLLWAIGIGLALLFFHTWPLERAKVESAAQWLGCVVAAGAIAGGGIWSTQRLAKARKERAKQRRRGVARHASWLRGQVRRFSIFIAPIAIVLAIALPFIAHERFPAMDPLAKESLWLMSLAIFTVALVAVGALVGGADHGGALPKIGFGILGLVHASIQVALPYLLATRGWVIAVPMVLASWLVFVPARWLYMRDHKLMVTLLYLVQGLGAIAALWVVPWPAIANTGWHIWVLVAALGLFVVPMQFGFYVLTASAWNGHNNEVGISARLPRYKQWIRFHVTPERLTGYVIAFDDPTAGGQDAKPYLVDVFTIAPAEGSRRVGRANPASP